MQSDGACTDWVCRMEKDKTEGLQREVLPCIEINVLNGGEITGRENAVYINQPSEKL